MANTALRMSGLLLVIGAMLLGTSIVKVSFNPVINQQFARDTNVLFFLSAVLLLLSLPGMYFRQANSAGWLGFTGYLLLQAGIVLLIVIAVPPLLYPSLKEASGENPIAFGLGIALTIGLFFTGIATIRAGVFPLWSGILLLAATLGFFFVFFVAEFLAPIAGQVGSAFFGILLALALVWVGLSNWTVH